MGALSLTASRSSIKPLGSNVFKVYPDKSGTDTIRVYANKKMIYSAMFIVEKVPDPIGRIGGFLDTILTVPQILSSPYLSIIFPSSNYKGNFVITGFSMRAKNIHGEMIFYEIEPTNQFSSRQIQIITRLHAGDKLYFDDIKVSCPGGRTRMLWPFTTIIK